MHKTVTTMAISFELMPLTLERVLLKVVKWADRHFSQPFVKDNWNIPSILFSVSKYIGDNSL
jgi:hypothetical protein